MAGQRRTEHRRGEEREREIFRVRRSGQFHEIQVIKMKGGENIINMGGDRRNGTR